MHEPTKSKAENPGDKRARKESVETASPASELKNAQRELKRVMNELERCKKELKQKEQALSKLSDELDQLGNSHQFNEKEAAIERMATDMQRAQEMATMGSWNLDVRTEEVSWTPELHRMFGQDPSSPVPGMQEQKTCYSEASYRKMVAAITRTIEDGSPYNIELEIIRKDGSTGIVRSIGEAERDETGQVIRLRGVAQDITEIKEAEAKLKRALEEEKAAQIYKDQFLANMSHEIRTPMNGVVGFASLLRDEDLDSATRNEYINTIESCSNQLLNLIDDILDVAKIEAGKMEIDKELIHLEKLTHEVAATYDGIKDERGKGHIRLITRIPEVAETLQIYSDPLRIQQILTNLLNNALKFADQGTIEFGFTLNDKTVEFFVKDEGIGIEPERIKLIFERFQHLEGSEKKYEGTGLGLSISKGLAELLGATLTVESEPGVGSTFRLGIPLEAETAPRTKAPLPSPESESKGTHVGTVLIVEDEEPNQRLIQKMLSSASFEILLAHNGEQAVDAYRKNPEISVVLMDIRMPVMNGDKAAQEILKLDPMAKIIAQTAFAMQQEREKLLQVGFVDYISKPYKKQELLAIVEKWAKISN